MRSLSERDVQTKSHALGGSYTRDSHPISTMQRNSGNIGPPMAVFRGVRASGTGSKNKLSHKSEPKLSLKDSHHYS